MRPVALYVFIVLTIQAQAATWVVDHTQSRLGFTAQWSGSPFSGQFRKWDAKIEFDPADIARARADITIDMTSAFSGEADIDENLPGVQGFHAARFPDLRFVTRAFRAMGGKPVRSGGRPYDARHNAID
jgi:polyisoprenoid-binding protein YceI